MRRTPTAVRDTNDDFLLVQSALAAMYVGPLDGCDRVCIELEAAALQHEADRISNVLLRRARQASRLIIELTHTAAITDVTGLLIAMENMAALGVRFAICGLGSRACAFELLRELPFHVAKLDPRYVADAAAKPADAEIIRALVTVAHTLEMLTIAPGVRTQEDLPLLESLGVDVAQGYVLHRPERLSLAPLHRYFVSNAA